MTNIYLDIHVLQTVPPSNLNRDDAGSPKQAIFGGARRARVSSQAWKRATRKHFAASPSAAEDPATRTDRLAVLFEQGLVAHGVEGTLARRAGEALLRGSKISVDESAKKKKPESYLPSAYLLFVGRAQVERVVEHARARLPVGAGDLTDGELAERLADVPVQAELSAGHPAEVALFGRMVADIAALNVDAAVQVAHAISTHAVDTEFDYFTAVDDQKDRTAGDDLGAGMIGTIEFNSATLYRYATLGVGQLLENLGGAEGPAVDAARRFVDGFVRSMPTGHQTSFAHRTLPEAVVIVLRDDQPVNLVSAFENPVRSRDGFSAASLVALAREYDEVGRRWGGAPSLVGSTYSTNGLGRCGTDHPTDGATASQLEVVERFLGESRQFHHLLDRVETAVRDGIGRLGS